MSKNKKSERLNQTESTYIGDYCSIKELLDAVKRIPSQYRKSAKFVVESEYGSTGGSIYLTWERPENDAEYQQRMSQEDKSREWRRQQYEALKKEFEGVVTSSPS